MVLKLAFGLEHTYSLSTGLKINNAKSFMSGTYARSNTKNIPISYSEVLLQYEKYILTRAEDATSASNFDCPDKYINY